MKKLVILVLLVSFCGGDSETSAVEGASNTSTTFTTSSSTTSSSTTTTSTTTTTKVLQAPAMKFELCDDEIDPTKNETWAYEVQIINFNSKIKAIECCYQNDRY